MSFFHPIYTRWGGGGGGGEFLKKLQAKLFFTLIRVEPFTFGSRILETDLNMMWSGPTKARAPVLAFTASKIASLFWAVP